ncbi:hypothetical protein HPB50_015851 [Hyalomma asiaticum]|uniref:Uncharacterized protein n=1 Tax=Hyalomma asiaticum TaxID=266040 RepID=A0ACB7RUT3_HYAAI|nr:hypothetical protein HPB50_015851 [Hyalomma asiaticum]
MLPDVDALVYVSTETVFLHPVEDFWRMFFSMNDQQMVGVAPGLESIASSFYLRISERPFVEPFGVNSDVLLMNLTRMRTFGLERRIAEITRENENFTVNAVQDALNILLARHPEAIFTFTCRWNYRAEHCYKDALCTDGPAAVVHGSYDTFMYSSPAFMALHKTMRQYDLGQSLLRGFIDPLKHALAIQAWDGCHVEFVRQLDHWRLSAHRVDVVSNRTSPLYQPAN